MMAGAGTLMSVATMVPMKELKLMMPRLRITGPMSTPTRRTSGLRRLSRQGERARRLGRRLQPPRSSRASSAGRPRRQRRFHTAGTCMSSSTTVPDEHTPGQRLEAVAGGERDHHPDDDQVPDDRREGRHGEVVVGVEDAHEDARDPHDHHGGEHDAHEMHGQVRRCRGSSLNPPGATTLTTCGSEDHAQDGDDAQDAVASTVTV